MKHPSFLLLLSVFLASCGQEVAPPTSSPVSPVKTEVVAPISETSETLKSENKTNERELLNIENSKDSISKCGEDFNHNDANEFVPFEIKGLSISIPFNHAWGTSKCRVSPYEEFNNEVYFGRTLGGTKGYDFGRSYRISIVPSRKTEDIIHEIKKEKNAYLKDSNQVSITFLTPEIITLNEFTAVSWEGVPGLTDSSNIEIVWKNANYIFRALDSKENLIKLVRSMNLASTKTNSSTSNTISPLSDTQIQDILAKIDANTKAQQEMAKNATGVLVQGDFRAEYVSNNFDVSKADSIIVTKNGIQKSIPWIYKPIADGSHFSFISKFMEFSPSGNYLLYETPCEAQCPSGLINTENGEVVLRFTNINYHEWTLDRKRFIYAEPTARDMTLQLSITVRGAFPKAKTLIEKGFLDATIEWNFLYARTLYKTTEDGSMLLKDSDKKKFLHIFDLTTDKEVFSKEIQN